MHSRIIELSKEPDLKQERISEASIPEWFCNTIADYTDANTDRDHDIKWFLSCVGNYVDVAEDGQSFTFRPKAKQMHFERSYHTFLDKVCELTGISLGAFVGETKYDIGMAMYKPFDDPVFMDLLELVVRKLEVNALEIDREFIHELDALYLFLDEQLDIRKLQKRLTEENRA